MMELKLINVSKWGPEVQDWKLIWQETLVNFINEFIDITSWIKQQAAH